MENRDNNKTTSAPAKREDVRSENRLSDMGRVVSTDGSDDRAVSRPSSLSSLRTAPADTSAAHAHTSSTAAPQPADSTTSPAAGTPVPPSVTPATPDDRQNPSAPAAPKPLSGWRAWIGNFLNTLVLLGSILIIVGLSIEVFHDSDQLYVKLYTRLQLWVCVIFLVDFFFRLFVSRRKWRFLLANFAFFLVSIPYLDIFGRFGIELTGEVYYLIRLLPLVRGGYGLAIMVGWITRNRLTSLMVSYVLIIAALVYFVSLVFFSLEHGVNPMVTTYQSALMWALMNVTTVGSDIYATTLTGQIMAVVLASAGMMMFPIFTVYITNHFRTHHIKKKDGDWI